MRIYYDGLIMRKEWVEVGWLSECIVMSVSGIYRLETEEKVVEFVKMCLIVKECEFGLRMLRNSTICLPEVVRGCS